jgi:DNA-binding beta-propeller fold protein YncE
VAYFLLIFVKAGADAAATKRIAWSSCEGLPFDELLPDMRLSTIFLAGVLTLNVAAQPALELVRTIPLPGVSGRIDHVAADPQGHRLFVAARGNDTVEVLDVDNARRLQAISDCSEPQGLVYLSKPNRLFIANGGSDELKVYDGEKFQLLKTSSALLDVDNTRADAAGNLVYVGYGRGALGVFDTNGVQVASIPLDGHPESFHWSKTETGFLSMCRATAPSPS